MLALDLWRAIVLLDYTGLLISYVNIFMQVDTELDVLHISDFSVNLQSLPIEKSCKDFCDRVSL